MGRLKTGSITVEWQARGWRAVGARAQHATLAAIEQGTVDILPIVKAYAPYKEGSLRESLKIGPTIPYGPSRVQISIISDSPYFNWITRGIPDGGMTVGQEGKFYGNKAKGIAFVGPWTWRERPGNNFPKTAIRSELPKMLDIFKKHFITRLKGPG